MSIVVTGGSGLVGTSLKKYLPNATYLSSKDYNLTKVDDVVNMYKDTKPNLVIHLAARVGGIMENIKYPVQFLDENVLMNTLITKYAFLTGCHKMIAILSTCIYPDVVSTYPMTEKMLHDGIPTKTNLSYAYAKRLMAIQLETYNQQYGTEYNYLIPSNLYGEHDNFKFDEKMHFLTALLKKIIVAKKNNVNEIKLFGDGSPLRQFLYADDLAKVIKYYVDNNIKENVNVASEENLSIKDIALTALKACDAENLKIIFDDTKPVGQYRKDVDISLLKSVMPDFNATSLENGIKNVYDFVYDKIS